MRMPWNMTRAWPPRSVGSVAATTTLLVVLAASFGRSSQENPGFASDASSPPGPPWRYGRADTRFTLIEYADLECPYCQAYFPTLRQWIDTSTDVNWQWHHLPLAMHEPAVARVVPTAVGVVVLLAGALQFTAWKARRLACCRQAPGRGRTLPADARTAWRYGLRLGLHCSACCAGLTTMLLVLGVMDLRAMAVVTAAITVERLAPAGARVAHAIGVAVVGAGMLLIARAGGLA